MIVPPTFCTRVRFTVIAVMLLLSACTASGFRADVSRFHQLSEPSGQTFQVISGANVEDEIEFKSYLGMLTNHLNNVGYQTSFDNDPQYQVFLDYGSRPDPNYRPSSGPLIGIGFGGFGSHVGGSVGTTINTSDTNTVYYLHSVNVIITHAVSGQRLYEGTASGHAKGASINSVMPLLLDALFQDFPGTSGITDTVKFDSQ